jgi:hypothetical protein
MEVHFTPEQEKRLTQIAASAGTDPERLVKDAALRLLEEQPTGSPALPAGSVVEEMRALRAHQARSRRLDQPRLRPTRPPLDGPGRRCLDEY